VNSPYELVAVGDFNGDGKQDFIVSYWHKDYEITLVYTLYLGQADDSGHPVIPVALFF
jgi:hypothetical protein